MGKATQAMKVSNAASGKVMETMRDYAIANEKVYYFYFYCFLLKLII